MNTNLTREQISALVDGELEESRIDAVLALLQDAEGRAAWERYHQAGDALRSDDIPLTVSADFSRNLFARLDAEPIIIAPAALPARTAAAASQQDIRVPASASVRQLKRFALPGMVAAAAVATVAFITTPQLMMSGARPEAAVAVAAQPALTTAALEPQATLVPAAAEAEPDVMLRDPRIDDYLFAHQRFSSSVYSTAQFARSTTFTSHSGK